MNLTKKEIKKAIKTIERLAVQIHHSSVMEKVDKEVRKKSLSKGLEVLYDYYNFGEYDVEGGIK